MDHHLEQENHKLRENVTTLRAENEILRNLISLMTVAQSQPFSLGQQFTPSFQTGHPTPQATVTYTAPLVHTAQQEEGQIYPSNSVAGDDRVGNLERRLDARVDAVQKELKTMRGKEVFGQNVHDLCFVPNVVTP